MFEKLIDAILALTAELKRYNDSGTKAANAKADPIEKATKPAPEKAAPEKAAKPVAEKAAPKKAEISVADVQGVAAKFIANNSRDAFITLLKGLGYANISGAAATDGVEGLTAIHDALTAALEEVDPAA
jgi:hypothetical protein